MIGVDTTFLVQLEIAELPDHSRAHAWLRTVVLEGGEDLALVPQVLAEFIHIVTDPRRFEAPLSMDQAIAKARFWWSAMEVRHVYPSWDGTVLSLDWLTKHGLGRKRLLDTQLAATLYAAGVRRIVTSNARDFSLFEGMEVVVP
jgi:predicted nucleic acid-binding protein